VSDKNLPIDIRLSWLVRQMKFQKEQAITSVWFLSSLLISITLVSPIVHSLNKAFPKTDLIPLLNGVVFIVVFISTWYGLLFGPLVLMKRFTRPKKETP
jgi:hypothetical protein